MNESTEPSTDPSNNQKNIWVRCLFMLLMILAYHVSWTVVFIVSIIQFVIMLMNNAANTRLVSFGRSLGGYQQQIVHYLTFATEEVPFPFNDWPAGE